MASYCRVIAPHAPHVKLRIIIMITVPAYNVCDVTLSVHPHRAS